MKMHLFKLVAVGLAIIALLTACDFSVANLGTLTRVAGSGQVATESRNVSGFNGLIVNGAGNLTINRTGTESLSITTDDNLMQYIVTEVRGDKLVIDYKPKTLVEKVSALSFMVTAKDLSSITINGAAAIDAKNLQGDQFSISVSGASTSKLAGKVDQLTITLNGTGGINAENLEAKRAVVTNSGAGTVTVRATDSLNATISGIGYIEYIGNPQVTKSISGLGAVRQR